MKNKMEELIALEKSLEHIKNRMMRIIISAIGSKNPKYLRRLEKEFSMLQAQADYIILLKNQIQEEENALLSSYYHAN